MRQLITRIDEELHTQLKHRAAQEGRSLNDLVTEVLSRAVAARAARERVRERARRRGLLFEPPAPDDAPTLEAVLAATCGAGSAFSDALDDVRDGQ
jgi:plasmid stability protein